MMVYQNPFALLEESHAQAGRIILGLEYNGAVFHGWQRQEAGVPSIQEHLEQALSHIAREPITVTCSGRTDAGVHATGQVVHFDTTAARPAKAWVMGANTSLPYDIRVRWAMPAQSEDFHARYTAVARRYRYIIYNHRIAPALLHDQVTHCREPLDVDRMHRAAQCLLGEHDFSAFRASGCQSNTPWREIHFVRVVRQGLMVVIDIQGNAFLHHMVRNIAGSLMAVGSGNQTENWFSQVLASRDRTKAGVTAPANGLHFVAALYPKRFKLPLPPLGPHYLALNEALDAPYPELDPAWRRHALPPAMEDK